MHQQLNIQQLYALPTLYLRVLYSSENKQRYISGPTRYTKCVNEWVYSSCMLALHVSYLTGPSSGAFCRLYLHIWYVVIRVVLDTSSRYEVVGRTVIFYLIRTVFLRGRNRIMKSLFKVTQSNSLLRHVCVSFGHTSIIIKFLMLRVFIAQFAISSYATASYSLQRLVKATA